MGIHNPRQQLFYHNWQLQANKLKSFQFSHKIINFGNNYIHCGQPTKKRIRLCMFSLCGTAFAPAQKFYWTGFQFSNGDFGKISVMEQSCAPLIAKFESQILDSCSYCTR